MFKTTFSLACFPLLFTSSSAAANPGQIPLSSMQLIGSATLLNDGYIRLTRNAYQAASAFVPTPFTLGPHDSFAALSGADGVRYVWVEYQNSSKVMRGYYSATTTMPGTPLLQTVFPVDLSTVFGGQIYFGVTGGTGACYSQQFVLGLGLNVVNEP